MSSPAIELPTVTEHTTIGVDISANAYDSCPDKVIPVLENLLDKQAAIQQLQGPYISSLVRIPPKYKGTSFNDSIVACQRHYPK